MKKWLVAVAALFTLFVFHGIWTWDGSAPELQWGDTSDSVGKDSRITLRIQDTGKGLRSIDITLGKSGGTEVVLSEAYSMPWPWQDGVGERSIALSPRVSFGEDQLTEGDFWLEVRLRDHPNFWLWDHPVSERRPFRLDLTPPRIEVLSRQHYIRQGGSETILYRVSSDTETSGVQVGERVFRGYPLPVRGEGVHVCLFALAHDQSPQAEMRLWAEDLAGNRAQTSFQKTTFPVGFRNRNIQLTDAFMESVVPEILEHTDEVSGQDSLLATFLEINGELRRMNHDRLTEIHRRSASRLLWSEPFVQLSNSQVESAFADHRTYHYMGKEVDQQTHLGFDLASVARSPVGSANDGIVVLADYFGIYGNTVLVDHGLGLLSLYGHLSRIDVQEGQPVKQNETLGLTGQTGLAAGDHLHFSLILQGVQVNPLEWWDPRWIRDHVLTRVSENVEIGSLGPDR